MYAEPMELFSLIINLAAELAKLARLLLTDGIRFMALLARSRTALECVRYTHRTSVTPQLLLHFASFHCCTKAAPSHWPLNAALGVISAGTIS